MNYPKSLGTLLIPITTIALAVWGIGVGFLSETNACAELFLHSVLAILLLICLVNGISLRVFWRFDRFKNRETEEDEPLRLEIGERQRLEDMLRHEIAVLAKVMETSPIGMLIIDSNGSIIGASERAEQILDISKEDISRGAFNVHQWQLTNCQGDPIPVAEAPFQQVLTSRQTLYDLRCALELPNGRRVLLSINASPLFDEGAELEGVVFAIEDINERVRVENALLHSEAQFRGIFEQAAVGICIVSLSGQFIRVNQRYGELVGYTSEELLEKTFLEITHPDDRAIDQELTSRLLEQGTSFSLEKRYIRQDGSDIWVNLSASAIRDVTGEPMYLIGIIEDISKRKKALKALQESIEELEQRNRDSSLLNQMSDFLQSCRTVEEAYQVIRDRLPSLFPHCHGGLFMLQDESNLIGQEMFSLVVTWDEHLNGKTLFPVGECWALRRGQAYHIDRDHSHLFCQHTLSETLTDSLCVPMTAQGKAIGLLHLNTEKKGHLNEAKRQLAQTVAEQLSLALGNLKLRETLEEQSIRDSLTGLFNYRYLEEALDREVQLANRKAHPIGIMMIDVDHFRNFNNTYGHDAGNVVLKAMSDFLLYRVRNVDIVCRYGGEEFLLILPEMGLENLWQRAQSIREGVKQLQLTFQNIHLPPITVSIGIACFPEHGVTREELIRSADTALYCAKDNGRNCVVKS